MLSFLSKIFGAITSFFDFIFSLPQTFTSLISSFIGFFDSLGAIGTVISVFLSLLLFAVIAYIIYLIVKLVLSLIP